MSNEERASELERRADLLDAALLAPSLKAKTLREQAAQLRKGQPEIVVNGKPVGHGMEGMLAALLAMVGQDES